MRKNVIAGNWKMNTVLETAEDLAEAIVRGIQEVDPPERSTDVVLCPPFPFIGAVGEAIRNTAICLGAQTMHDKASGAFTGEVSGQMLKSIGCEYVIVGHSERRLNFAESDLDVSLRANAAVTAGLIPIICVGETEAEREDGRTNSVVGRQVKTALDGIFEFNVRQCVFAYEPIWAIGTSKAATPVEAEEVHLHIRGLIKQLFGEAAANDVSIIYGGSLTETNAQDILGQPNIDGGLVGGASLEARSFVSIVRAASEAHAGV
jgi:triosephosphate isomerase